MKKNIRINWSAAAILALISASPAAQASTITGLYNTGVDNAGNTLSNGTLDTHYSLVPPAGPLQAFTSANGFPIPPWLGDDSLSTWIGPNNSSATGPGGAY